MRLANKYERLIEKDDRAFYKKFGKKKKKKAKPSAKTSTKKKPSKNEDRPFIPYKKQLLDERWLKRRKQVLACKGHKCEMCGATKYLQIHHKRYIKGKYAWEYKMKDYLVLCANCHEKTHGIDLDRRMDFLIETN